ncbi:MAG: hypothetical protein E7279_09835 [Lachnospiraceae bacterium]|nr:hypothetical protein [Lachnospiraceae bacterium]
MSMLTLKLGEISANIASRRLEEAEKKYRLEKLLMTDEERAEAERRDKKAHDEVWARIERGKALTKAIVNGEDLDEFFEDYEHGTLTMTEEEIREHERLESEDEDDDDID